MLDALERIARSLHRIALVRGEMAAQEAEAGSSTGTLAMPISEVSLEGFEGLAGTLTGGPFPAGAKLVAASLYESFEGAGSCGASPPGKKKAKPVKKGFFVTSPVEIEP